MAVQNLHKIIESSLEVFKVFLILTNIKNHCRQVNFNPDLTSCKFEYLVTAIKLIRCVWNIVFDCICFDHQQTKKKQEPSKVHKNGQNNNELGQISKIFESSNYFQLHNFMSICYHKSLKTIILERFRGLNLTKHVCRS